MPNVLPTNPSILGHIFRHDAGHLPDTLENRELLTALANDETAYLGTDRYQVRWYVKMQADETQLWVQVWMGVIFDGGLNLYPKPYNLETGLKRP